MSRFLEWYFAPARCWEFWKPQSGIPGGVLAGLLILTMLAGLKA